MSKGSSNDKTAGPKIDLSKPDTDSPERRIAREMLRPTINAAFTVYRFNKDSGEPPLTELVQELTHQVRACETGDLSRGEDMLMAQAHTLDSIFNDLARRAQMNMGHYPETAERYLRLALKAQAQSRANVEALANIKNPRPVAYVQQANIGQAVQVNNGTAEKTRNEPNELLEAKRGNEWLDPGKASATSRERARSAGRIPPL